MTRRWPPLMIALVLLGYALLAVGCSASIVAHSASQAPTAATVALALALAGVIRAHGLGDSDAARSRKLEVIR